MRKLVIAVGSVLVLVVAVVGFLLVHDFDSPDLGKRLLDKVSAATGVTITAQTFHLNLLHGLKLGGVDVKTESGGRTTHVTLDTLLFEHRIGPLFSGTVAIEKVLLDRPVIEIVESAAPAAAGGEPAAPPAPAPQPSAPPSQTPPGSAPSGGSAPAEQDKKLSLELKELTISDARVSIADTQGGRVQIEGFTVNLRDIGFNPNAKSLAAITGTGDIAIAKATLNATVLTDTRTNFQLANAAFTMPELATTTEYGKVTAATTLDLKPEPFTYEMKATGSAIDLNTLIGATGGFGPGSLQLDVKGEGPDVNAVKANGSVKLAAGTIPVAKISQAIDQALGKTILAGKPYKAVDAPFSLDRGVIALKSFRFEMENARVDLKGTAKLTGPLDLDLSLATPREGIAIDGVGGATLDVLSDASGWIPVPIHVGGTLDDPNVRPDSSALLAQAKTGAKREAKEAAQATAQKGAQKAGAALKKKLKKDG